MDNLFQNSLIVPVSGHSFEEIGRKLKLFMFIMFKLYSEESIE